MEGQKAVQEWIEKNTTWLAKLFDERKWIGRGGIVPTEIEIKRILSGMLRDMRQEGSDLVSIESSYFKMSYDRNYNWYSIELNIGA